MADQASIIQESIPELTPHQQAALAEAMESAEQTGDGILYGFAGTGKSTVVATLAITRPRILFVAPTNKAAFVLRRKLMGYGVDSPQVATVHAVAYGEVLGTHEEEIRQAEHQLRHAHNEETQEHWGEKLRQAEKANQLVFAGSEFDKEIDMLVVDECSMLTRQLAEALRRSIGRCPVLWVGDPAQLPPVRDENADEEEGQEPFCDYADPVLATAQELSEVHRTGEGRLLNFLNWLRQQARVDTWKLAGHSSLEGDPTLTIQKRASTWTKRQFSLMAEHDLIICRTNDARWRINSQVRQQRGFTDWLPEPDEQVVVSHAPGLEAQEQGGLKCAYTGEPVEAPVLVKGTMLTVVEIKTDQDNNGYKLLRLLVREDEQGQPFRLVVPAMNFLLAKYGKNGAHAACGREGWTFASATGFQLDFAACVTAHKSQGGEFGSVCVYEQRAPMQQTETHWGTSFSPPDPAEHRRWLYTACSRAQDRLTLLTAPMPAQMERRARAGDR